MKNLNLMMSFWNYHQILVMTHLDSLLPPLSSTLFECPKWTKTLNYKIVSKSSKRTRRTMKNFKFVSSKIKT